MNYFSIGRIVKKQSALLLMMVCALRGFCAENQPNTMNLSEKTAPSFVSSAENVALSVSTEKVDKKALSDISVNFIGEKSSFPRDFYGNLTLNEFEQTVNELEKDPIYPAERRFMGKWLASETAVNPDLDLKNASFLMRRLDILDRIGEGKKALQVISMLSDAELTAELKKKKIELLFENGQFDNACQIVFSLKEHTIFRSQSQVSCFMWQNKPDKADLTWNLADEELKTNTLFRRMYQGKIHFIAGSMVEPVMFPLIEKYHIQIKTGSKTPLKVLSFCRNRGSSFADEKIKASEKLATGSELKKIYEGFGTGLQVSEIGEKEYALKRAVLFSTLPSLKNREETVRFFVETALSETEPRLAILSALSEKLAAAKDLTLFERKVVLWGALLKGDKDFFFEAYHRQKLDKTAEIQSLATDMEPLLMFMGWAPMFRAEDWMTALPDNQKYLRLYLATAEKNQVFGTFSPDMTEQRMSRFFEEKLMSARNNFEKARAVLLSARFLKQNYLFEKEIYRTLKLFGFQQEARMWILEKLCRDEFAD